MDAALDFNGSPKFPAERFALVEALDTRGHVWRACARTKPGEAELPSEVVIKLFVPGPDQAGSERATRRFDRFTASAEVHQALGDNGAVRYFGLGALNGEEECFQVLELAPGISG